MWNTLLISTECFQGWIREIMVPCALSWQRISLNSRLADVSKVSSLYSPRDIRPSFVPSSVPVNSYRMFVIYFYPSFFFHTTQKIAYSHFDKRALYISSCINIHSLVNILQGVLLKHNESYIYVLLGTFCTMMASYGIIFISEWKYKF